MEQGLFRYTDKLELELGGQIKGFELHYSTLGNLNKDRNNVIWVCHALTANSDFSDWWSGFVENVYDPSE
jgi:homoserine O-acetyltransferase